LGRGPLVLVLQPLLLIILLLELLPRLLGLELILGGLDGRYHVHRFAVMSLFVQSLPMPYATTLRRRHETPGYHWHDR